MGPGYCGLRDQPRSRRTLQAQPWLLKEETEEETIEQCWVCSASGNGDTALKETDPRDRDWRSHR